ncbi:MAG: gluconate 2-dehydrogenase subunit 3 family protein [Burkholderiaceae bacterium]|nr:gluconate 2-dehydrogenase subunit 3 family protein [Burkholderiaceae bacterium]
MPWQETAADAPPQAFRPGSSAPSFFTATETAFITAAVARLIPKDELGPGAIEAGVPDFIDNQLAGDYGKATRWYMQGPLANGEATQGYQTRMTPEALYRTAIREIDEAVAKADNGALFTNHGARADRCRPECVGVRTRCMARHHHRLCYHVCAR